MASYLIQLAPANVSMAGEGSMDTSVLNGVSQQRTVAYISVTDGSGHYKNIEDNDGVVFDDSTYQTLTSIVGIVAD